MTPSPSTPRTPSRRTASPRSSPRTASPRTSTPPTSTTRSSVSGRTARRRPLASLAGALAVVLVAGACGVPTGGDSFEPIPDDDVLFDLSSPSTTTTSTTTTTTTTLVPATTVVPPPTIPPATAQVYFLSRDELRPVLRSLPFGFGANELISLLEEGPGESETLLDSEVDPGLIEDTTVSGGIATIDLDEQVFRRVPRLEQRSVIAQIVLTFVTSLPSVGQVQFTFDGVPADVRNGANLLTGDPVSFDDYANLLADAPAGATTTTTPEPVADTTGGPVESVPVDPSATTLPG